MWRTTFSREISDSGFGNVATDPCVKLHNAASPLGDLPR
jgi:hypothetical protein